MTRATRRRCVLTALLAAGVFGLALAGVTGHSPTPWSTRSSPAQQKVSSSPVPSELSRPRNCTTAPSRCGYPDATNTGIPPGTTLRQSGPVRADTDGEIIEALDVRGEINVIADDVTIRNTRVVAGGGDWVVIIRPGADRLTIVDSEISAPAGVPQDNACVFNIGDSSPTLRRVNIHGCSAGVSSGAGLVLDSYIHDLGHVPGLSHIVGIASNGGGGMTVRHNTVLNNFGQTAAVAFYQDFGTQHDDMVEGNLLAGGGYCFYGGAGDKGPTARIRFLNNRLSRHYFEKCGSFGVSASFIATDPGNEWAGNHWDDTGAVAS